jgi:hypothetical protein
MECRTKNDAAFVGIPGTTTTRESERTPFQFLSSDNAADFVGGNHHAHPRHSFSQNH